MITAYENLTGRRIDTSSLTAREKRIVSELLLLASRSPDWEVFSDQWQRLVSPIVLRFPGPERTKHPLYKIAQDLEMRLGIAQGVVAPPDYRDYIFDRIESKFGSRYRFCQETGIPQAFLSQVLSGQKDFSIETLRRAAEALDMSLALLPLDDLASATGTDSSVLTKASAIIADELAVLEKARARLGRIRDRSKLGKILEKDRSLFESVLSRLSLAHEALEDARSRRAIVAAIESEIARLTKLLDGLREEAAKVASSGAITSRKDEPKTDRASMSRV